MSALDVATDGIVKEAGVSLATIRARAALDALTAGGYRILAPGELDGETLEAAAAKADMWDTTTAGMISKAIRNLRSAG